MKALDRSLRRIEGERDLCGSDLTRFSDAQLIESIETQAKSLSHVEPQILISTSWLCPEEICHCGRCELYTVSIPAVVLEVYSDADDGRT